MTVIKIDPLTRIEGHLAIKLELEANPDPNASEKFRVKKGYSCGEMFRGVEVLLEGRDPMDSHQITQRICGVCPISHGLTSCMCQEDAYNVKPAHNGMLLQNLLLLANFIQSHVLHFYHLAALDFVDITAILKYTGKDASLNRIKNWAQSEIKSNKINPVAPFLPRYEGDYIKDADINIGALANYLKALDMRTVAHEMVAIFGGKAPHATAFIPTGVTSNAKIHRILRYQSRLEKLVDFIHSVYLPDVVAVAKAFPQYFKIGRGPNNYMSYGVFREPNGSDFLPGGVVTNWQLEEFDQNMITEDTRYSYFSSPSGLHPFDGQTVADPHKSGAYSWVKAPRYKGKAMEVGPLARMIVQYMRKSHPVLNDYFDTTLKSLGLKFSDLNSVMGRHLARAVECDFLAKQGMRWVEMIKAGEPTSREFEIPNVSKGYGCSEAPRGALGHWMRIKDHLIEKYQCVVPTTWLASPRDDQGQAGAIEQALEKCPIADPKNPLEAARIVRSFDPCLACAIH